MALAGKVCLVTGATRGLGRGISVQLGENGATVYITGRTLEPKGTGELKGSLRETSDEIVKRGGKCVSVQCDHSNDEEVERLFDQIEREQDGHLDILVNSAYSAVGDIVEKFGRKFWEQPLSFWDSFNHVGLRNTYRCIVMAAKLMVPRRSGLIVNLSSPGALKYAFNVPYGVGKEAVDRISVDCGLELINKNVACLSIWTGYVKTENVDYMMEKDGEHFTDRERAMMNRFKAGESTEFMGKCVVNLALDKNIMKKTAKAHISCDLADEYSFVDIDGRKPTNVRQFNFILMNLSQRLSWLAGWVPDWVKIPTWILHMSGNKLN